MKKIIIVILTLMLIGAISEGVCDTNDSTSNKRTCKICGKEYSFNWSDVCNGCKNLSEQGWFDDIN